MPVDGSPCTAVAPAGGRDAAMVRAELAVLRPSLVAAFDAAVPGARAAVLARLWDAVSREPLPRLRQRRVEGDRLTAVFDGGVSVSGRGTEPERVTVSGAVAGLGGVAGPDGAGVVVRDPGVLARALGFGQRFAAELDDSVANLALARAAAAAAPSLAQLARLGPVAGLARAEQAVVDGHPRHPGCRTRLPMSTADVLAYAPEHGALVSPVLLGVPARRWAGGGPPVLVAHPWQVGRLRQAYPFLEVVGVGPVCRPLLSLRTLAPVEGGPHLKTAVDVQMTSAVRTVSAAALHNGPRLSVLLRRLTADLPVQVLAEFGGGAVIGADGRPDRRAAFLRRAAPRVAAGEVVLPLAAAEVVGGVDGAVWTAALARLLPALYTLLGRGVALEAHGQNLLVVVRDGRPVRLLYRDLGGVRVHRGRLGERLPPLIGDLVTDDEDELATTLSAALLGGALAGSRVVDGAVLAAAVGYDGPVPVKATTAMRLAADPLRPLWVGAA